MESGMKKKEPRKYGLLVGVSRYQEESRSSLPAAGEDLRLMKSALTDGLKFDTDDIRVLGEAGTVPAKSFARALSEFEGMICPEDIFVLYFSGHGTTQGLCFSDSVVDLQSIVDFVERLSARSKIVLFDQAETPMHDISLEMKKNHPNADIELIMGDVRNRARVEEAFAKFRPCYVFHAAAYKHVPMMEINPTEAILANVMGTRNVADLALKYGVYKFVMISTDKAVNPTNVMGCTKRLAEIYCQSLFFEASKQGKKTQFITTRFGNVLGSNGSVIPLFRKQIAAGGPVTVTHKEIIRYFMTIPEACSLVLEAGCMGSGGEIYIFDMGEPGNRPASRRETL